MIRGGLLRAVWQPGIIVVLFPKARIPRSEGVCQFVVNHHGKMILMILPSPWCHGWKNKFYFE